MSSFVFDLGFSNLYSSLETGDDTGHGKACVVYTFRLFMKLLIPHELAPEEITTVSFVP